MEHQESVSAYDNPLAFIQVEEPWVSVTSHQVTDDDLRKYLCQPGVESSLESIVARYRQISVESTGRLFAAPLSTLEKLVWPLRNAKASYALANYLGCIALCGIVAEMTAILIFEAAYEWPANASTINAGFADKKVQDPARFERLGQTQRVKALFDRRLVDARTRDRFSEIRLVRRRYLHLLSEPTVSISVDAIQAFLAAVECVSFAFGLSVANGSLVLRPEMLAWLKAHDSRSRE